MRELQQKRHQRMQERMQELLHQYRPDRYTVDENGWADWLETPVRIIEQEYGTLACLGIADSDGEGGTA